MEAGAGVALPLTTAGSSGSSGSRGSTPTTAIRLRPRIPTTLTSGPVARPEQEAAEKNRIGATENSGHPNSLPGSFWKPELPVARSGGCPETERCSYDGSPIGFPGSATTSGAVQPSSCRSLIKNSVQEEEDSVISGHHMKDDDCQSNEAAPNDVIRPSIRRSQSHKDNFDIAAADVIKDGDRPRRPFFLGLIPGKPEMTSVGRAQSMMLRRSANPLRTAMDFLSGSVHRRTGDAESPGSPSDSGLRIPDLEVQRPASNSQQGSGLRSESATDVSTDRNNREEARRRSGRISGTGRGGKPDEPEVGTSVLRSFSLRRLRTLDRFATHEVVCHQRSDAGSHVTQSAKMADDEGVAVLEPDVPDPDSRIRFHLHPEPEMPPRQTAKIARFLTHPPGRERGPAAAAAEQGAVDSNGLGPLREGADEGSPQTPNDDDDDDDEGETKTSFSSIDSHIDGSERVFFSQGDGDRSVDDETGPGRQDRKNSKVLKQKSKSDPVGEASGLPPSLVAIAALYAQSSPVIIDADQEQFSFAEGHRRPSEGRQANEDTAPPPLRHLAVYNASSNGSVESPTPEDKEVSAVLRGEEDNESFDLDRVRDSFKPPPPRPRTSKRRPRPIPVEDSSEKSEDNSSSNCPSTPADAPAAVEASRGGGKSRTLPHFLSRKTVPRGQTSGESDRQPEVGRAPPEVQSPVEETPSPSPSSSLGVRGRRPSGSQDFHRTAASSSSSSGGIRSVTSAIGDSVQELYRSASPRFKARTGSQFLPPSSSASFSPSLDTILSQSALSLFEATSSEDKVRHGNGSLDS